MSSCQCPKDTTIDKQIFDFNWKYAVGESEDIRDINSCTWVDVDVPYVLNTSCMISAETNDLKGIIWFKKQFSVPQAWSNKSISIQFDGVTTIDKILVNGEEILTPKKTSKALVLDVTQYVKEQSENVIVLQMVLPLSNSLNKTNQELGIYNHTWLLITNQSGSIH